MKSGRKHGRDFFQQPHQQQEKRNQQQDKTRRSSKTQSEEIPLAGLQQG